jgi:hypothetical protein
MALRFVMERTTSATCTGWSGAAGAVFCKPRPSTWPTSARRSSFHKVDTVVLTSATLAVAGGFEYVQKRLGVENRAHADCARPFRLSEAGAALRAAPSARAQAARRSCKAASRKSCEFWAQPRARVRAVHQLSADAAGVRPRVVRHRISHADAGDGPRTRCSTSSGRNAELRAVRDFVVLAGRGRAGRAVELRYHR